MNKKIRNISLRTKILFLFSSILILMLISTLIFFSNGKSTVSKYQEIINSISLSGQIRGNFTDLILQFDTLKELSDKKSLVTFNTLSKEEKDSFYNDVEIASEAFNIALSEINLLLNQLNTVVSDDTKKSINKLSSDVSTIKNTADQGIKVLSNKEDMSQAITQDHKGRMYDIKKLVDVRLLDILDSELKAMEQKNSSIKKDFNITTFISLAILILILVAGSTAIFIFTASIKRKLSIMGHVSNQIANGNLMDNSKLLKIQGDELGDLAEEVERMRISLRQLVNDIQEASGSVSEASENILEQLTAGNEVNHQIVETITTLNEVSIEQNGLVHNSLNRYEEVGEAVSSVHEVATRMTRQVLHANKISENGQDKIQVLLEHTNTIEDVTLSFVRSIKDLIARLGKIDKIVVAISTIASQTNLLSLNAKIEAARAGEAGLGFAVVSSQIGKLADQSTKAAKDIAVTISEIQSEACLMADKINEEIQLINQNNNIASDVSSAFTGIKNATEEISLSFKEVFDRVEQVREKVLNLQNTSQRMGSISGEITDMCNNTMAASEQQGASLDIMYSSSKNLNELSGHLRNAIEKFKV